MAIGKSISRKSKTAKSESAGAEVFVPSVPPEIRRFLGESPLLPGEDRSAYDDLLARLSRTLGPADTMEWLFLGDVLQAVRNVQALRKARAEILRDGFIEALMQAITAGYQVIDRTTEDSARAEALKDVKRFLEDPTGQEEDILDLLSLTDITLETAKARGMILQLDQLTAVDRMISLETARRDAALREADRWRSGMGRRLAIASEEIIDVDPMTGEP